MATVGMGGVANASAANPTINSESVTNVTEHNATLSAEINPNGSLTKYRLQIDTTGNFNFYQPDSCPLHPPGISCAGVVVPGEPLPPGLVEPAESTLPAGTESNHVSVDLATIGATLQSNTTYHFRAIAANGPMLVLGPDQTFITPTLLKVTEGEARVDGPIDEQEAREARERIERENPAARTADSGPPCLVPRLKGLSLNVARKRLGRTGCRLGQVTRRKAANPKKPPEIFKQNPPAGARSAPGAHVAVSLLG